MSENIENIKAFYQECNNLLKDITIEWIKEDEQIGETIKGDEILEYKQFPYNQYYIDYIYNSYYKYKCKTIDDYYFISKQNNNTMNIHNNIYLGQHRNNYSDYNVYSQKIEYFETLNNEFIKINNPILTIITMILNSIDYKFYKLVDSKNEDFIISNNHNIIYNFKQSYDDHRETKLLPQYKKLQIKFNNEIIFSMVLLNHKDNFSYLSDENKENNIFNCFYKYNNKLINFNLIDYFNHFNCYQKCYSSSINYCHSLHLQLMPIYNNPYGYRVFYNVIYSLENKLINQVSSKESSQEFINNQNYQNLILEKNQEIEELKNLLNKKSKYEDLQELIQKNLFSTLNDFKEKYEEQLTTNQEEFNKIKNEHIDNYHNSLLKINSSTNNLTIKNEKLINENEELKNKINKLNNNIENYIIKNNKLNDYTNMLNKYISEMIDIYKENYENMNEKTDKENKAIEDEETDEDTEETEDEETEDEENEAVEDEESDEDAEEAKYEEQYSINTLNSFKSNFISLIKLNKELNDKNKNNEQLINILKSKNNKLLFELEKINENNKHNLKNKLIQNSKNKFNTLNEWLTNNDINQYININNIPNININNNTLEELLDKAKEYYNYISIKNITYNEFKLYLKYILKIDYTKY